MTNVRIVKPAALCFVSLLATVCFASLPVARDDQKTIEGTVWLAGPAGLPVKMAGVPVTLLPPKARSALKSHLEEYDQLAKAAAQGAIASAITATLTAAQSKEALTKEALDKLSVQIAEARKKLEAVSALDERERAALAVAGAPIRAQLDELSIQSKSIASIISQQEALLVPEQASKDAAFAEKKALVVDALVKAEAHLADERRLEGELKAAIEDKKRSRSLSLHERYVADKIKISARLYFQCAACSPKLCVSIQNAGDKAVVSVDPQLFINGKDATSRVTDMILISSDWDKLKNISVENDYQEKAKGIPPSRVWPSRKALSGLDQCFVEGIYLNGENGDGKRAWENFGGLNAKTKVEIRIAKAIIADPQSLRSSESLPRHWE